MTTRSKYLRRIQRKPDFCRLDDLEKVIDSYARERNSYFSMRACVTNSFPDHISRPDYSALVTPFLSLFIFAFFLKEKLCKKRNAERELVLLIRNTVRFCPNYKTFFIAESGQHANKKT